MNNKKHNIVTGRLDIMQKIINIFPKKFRLRLNPRRYAIEIFVEKSA